MTCPFYVVTDRPECALGDDRAERHCGPRTYPAGPCNLDEIGRGEAWRAAVGGAIGAHSLWMACLDPDPYDAGNSSIYQASRGTVKRLLDAVGWSP